MHIGEKIKVLRNLRNITQTELAEKINKTRALVSHVEQTGKVNHYTFLSILKALKINEEGFNGFNQSKVLAKSNKPYPTNSEAEVLNEKLEHYQNENKLLREIIENQKEIIKGLKKK